MNFANHLVFGVGFTGVAASFFDVNIYAPVALAATAGIAILPDIDTPQSILGKLARPISIPLNRKFGHRTLTHSIFFLIATTSASVYISKPAAVICFFALLSHIIGDMITRAGVTFLYPFSSRNWVIPGDRAMRLRSDDMRGEIIIFVLSCLLILSTADLAQIGFKSAFNRAFMTFEHVKNEAEKAPSIICTPNECGQIVTMDGSKIWIWTGKDFKQLDENSNIKSIATADTLRQKKVIFQGITADSLRSLAQLVISAEIQSNYPFSYQRDGVTTTTKTAKLEYLPRFDFIEHQHQPDKEKELKKAKLEASLEIYESQFSTELREFSKSKAELENLKKTYSQLSNYEQGKAQKRITELEKTAQPQAPARIAELRAELAAIRAEATPDQVTFSGNITRLNQTN